MRIRASNLTMALAALLVALSTTMGCTHPGGKLMVDAPKMLPYQAPDIDEITGIDSSEEPEAASPSPAQNPQK